VAAQAMGINLTRTRLIAYAVSSFYGGMAGGLLALLLSYITPDGFTMFETIKVLAMIVIGGMGSIAGGILGAAVLTFGNEWLRFSQFFQEIGFGLLLLGAIILMPEGIAGLIRRLAARVGR
jgi:branched-chain amino acid transport system permease protein